MHKLKIKKSARKELDKLPDSLFTKIDKAILSLKDEPRPHPQSKQIKTTDKLRLRVGDYRVVYTVDDEEKIITVYRVRHRREVYRGL